MPRDVLSTHSVWFHEVNKKFESCLLTPNFNFVTVKRNSDTRQQMVWINDLIRRQLSLRTFGIREIYPCWFRTVRRKKHSWRTPKIGKSPFIQAIFVAATRCNFYGSKIASSFKHVLTHWKSHLVYTYDFEVATLARRGDDKNRLCKRALGYNFQKGNEI